MTQEVKVHDGYVRLIDSMGSDLSIVRSARTSYDAAWKAGNDKGSDTRLIRYLWANGHTTPFESVEFQFEVKAPIFVTRQWMRHRTWSYNEVSARYTRLPEEFYVPYADSIGRQSEINHQSRTDEDNPLAHAIVDEIFTAQQEAFGRYNDLIAFGCPRELARIVLPLGTYTKMHAKADLLNLLKFLKERTSEGAQPEIREYAEAIIHLITPVVPVTMEIWNGR